MPSKIIKNKKFKLGGRKPRKFDPRIKKMGELMAKKKLPAPPASVNWTKGVTQFGMMLNDTLGDCTCAAVYHARQIWTLNASAESTEPDADVLKLYENACGYNPADPSTDQGGVEQDVLAYLLNTGMPLANGTVDKIAAFVEVDPTNTNEVKTAINEFGVAYIGIDVPDSIFGPDGEPLPVWDYVAGSQSDGGHAVVLCGYDSIGCTFISWGQLYKMTWSFIAHCCDEVYAIADKNWIEASGKTPLGLTLAQLEALMAEIKV